MANETTYISFSELSRETLEKVDDRTLRVLMKRAGIWGNEHEAGGDDSGSDDGQVCIVSSSDDEDNDDNDDDNLSSGGGRSGDVSQDGEDESLLVKSLMAVRESFITELLAFKAELDAYEGDFAEIMGNLESESERFGVTQKLLAYGVDDVRDVFEQFRALSRQSAEGNMAPLISVAAEGIATCDILLASPAPCVVFFGETSSGKSTFLNMFLGRTVLPTSLSKCTAFVCEIVYGASPRLLALSTGKKKRKEGAKAQVLYQREDGQEESEAQLDADARAIEACLTMYSKTGETSGESGDAAGSSAFFGGERGSATLSQAHHVLRLEWPSEFLKAGLFLVDSPGLNDSEEQTDAVKMYLKRAIGVVVTVPAGKGLTTKTKSMLKNLIAGGEKEFAMGGISSDLQRRLDAASRLKADQVFLAVTKVDKCLVEDNGNTTTDEVLRLAESTFCSEVEEWGQMLSVEEVGSWNPDNIAGFRPRDMLDCLSNNMGSDALFEPLRVLSSFFSRMYSRLVLRAHGMISQPLETLHESIELMISTIEKAPQLAAGQLATLEGMTTSFNDNVDGLLSSLEASMTGQIDQLAREDGFLAKFVQELLAEDAKWCTMLEYDEDSHFGSKSRVLKKLKENLASMIDDEIATRLVAQSKSMAREAAAHAVNEVVQVASELGAVDHLMGRAVGDQTEIQRRVVEVIQQTQVGSFADYTLPGGLWRRAKYGVLQLLANYESRWDDFARLAWDSFRNMDQASLVEQLADILRNHSEQARVRIRSQLEERFNRGEQISRMARSAQANEAVKEKLYELEQSILDVSKGRQSTFVTAISGELSKQDMLDQLRELEAIRPPPSVAELSAGVVALEEDEFDEEHFRELVADASKEEVWELARVAVMEAELVEGLWVCLETCKETGSVSHLLSKRFAPRDRTLLGEAFFGGNVEIAQLLWSYVESEGADSVDLQGEDVDGWGLVHLALLSNNVELAKWVLKGDGNGGARPVTKLSVLTRDDRKNLWHAAVESNEPHVLRWLLESPETADLAGTQANERLDAEDETGRTPLEVAAAMGRAESVSVFLDVTREERGEGVSVLAAFASVGNNVLEYAIASRNLRVLRSVLRYSQFCQIRFTNAGELLAEVCGAGNVDALRVFGEERPEMIAASVNSLLKEMVSGQNESTTREGALGVANILLGTRGVDVYNVMLSLMRSLEEDESLRGRNSNALLDVLTLESVARPERFLRSLVAFESGLVCRFLVHPRVCNGLSGPLEEVRATVDQVLSLKGGWMRRVLGVVTCGDVRMDGRWVLDEQFASGVNVYTQRESDGTTTYAIHFGSWSSDIVRVLTLRAMRDMCSDAFQDFSVYCVGEDDVPRAIAFAALKGVAVASWSRIVTTTGEPGASTGVPPGAVDSVTRALSIVQEFSEEMESLFQDQMVLAMERLEKTGQDLAEVEAAVEAEGSNPHVDAIVEEKKAAFLEGWALLQLLLDAMARWASVAVYGSDVMRAGLKGRRVVEDWRAKVKVYG